jgi:hypothetical protein
MSLRSILNSQLHEVITINGKTPKSLGVTGMVLDLVNQGPSTATLTLRGAAATMDQLEAGDDVAIEADDFHFAGKVLHRPFTGSGRSGNSYEVVVVDDWQTFEDETILADLTLAANAIARDVRVAVGGRWTQYDTGTGEDAVQSWRVVPYDVATWMSQLLTDAGAILDNTVAGTLPPADADGIKIAEALRMILRWFPGCVATVSGQRSGASPKVTIRKVSSMSTFDAPYRAETTRITPRNDLILPGCALVLRKVTSSNLASKEDVAVSSAGAIGAGAFVAPFDLLPETHQLLAADLLLRKLEPETLQFWKDLYPGVFAQSGWEDATLSSHFMVREFEELTSVLLAGNIPPEFKDKGCSGPYSTNAKIFSATNSGTCKTGQLIGAASFTLAGGATGQITLQATGVSLTPIDSDNPQKPTRYVYENKEAKNPGESAGDFAGIAPAIYADGQLLRHEGEATWPVSKIPAFAALPMAKRIQFPDAPVEEWRTLGAPVYAVSIDCFRRTLTARFGHDGYLSAQDRVALQRAHKGWTRPKKERVGDDGGEPDDQPQQPAAPSVPPSVTQPAQNTFPDLGPFEPRGDKATGEIEVGASTVQGIVPSGMSAGNAPPYKFNGGASGYCWIATTRSGSSLGSVTIAHGSSEPGAGSDPNYKRALFSWERTGTAGDYTFNFAILRKGPIEASICQSAYDDSWSVTFDGGASHGHAAATLQSLRWSGQ